MEFLDVFSSFVNLVYKTKQNKNKNKKKKEKKGDIPKALVIVIFAIIENIIVFVHKQYI